MIVSCIVLENKPAQFLFLHYESSQLGKIINNSFVLYGWSDPKHETPIILFYCVVQLQIILCRKNLFLEKKNKKNFHIDQFESMFYSIIIICLKQKQIYRYTHGKLDTIIDTNKNRLRPYHVEYTSSRPITEVKQRRARLVLGWVTAWEYRVS